MTESTNYATYENVENTLSANRDDLRYDWSVDEVTDLFKLPLMDLVLQAQLVHRRYFESNKVQLSKLISVKTGGCPEDCFYCPQSGHYHTDVAAEKILALNEVMKQAKQARDEGASRFCMGAAWRNPSDKDLEEVCAMVEGVRDLGLETCATLGMLTEPQAKRLKQSGLDYYNHNLDTSEEYYSEIITTRTYESRLETVNYVRGAGINVCCGGILGMGEKRADRAELLANLANMDEHPESVPINMLIPVAGTPLEDQPRFDSIEFVSTIAIAKMMMPASVIRLSAGREQMSDELQALCFLAGASSIFVGEKLLTAPNSGPTRDNDLFARLGINRDERAIMGS